MKKLITILILIIAMFCKTILALDIAALEKQVWETETAFAQSMADRNFEAFKSFLDNEAVFLNRNGALRGKQAIAEVWKAYYQKADAPFSWKPEAVVVIESGTIAYSTGPVRNEAGKVFSYYTSVWRRNDQGEWKIILDKGQKYCE